MGFLAAASAFAQTPADSALPRRIQLGATLADVPDSLAAKGMPRGARVVGVVPGSSAQAAALQANDVVVRIGSDTVMSVAQALAALHPIHAGARVSLTVMRNRAPHELSFVARERPRESSTDFDILYTSVSARGVKQRVLVAHPTDGARHPGVLLLGGIGCYSVDQAGGVNAYRDLMDDLTRRGYTTYRVEKEGIGDSEGGSCLQTTFESELDGYAAALAAMRHSEWVDTTRIFLLGHSIGGIEAPLLAGAHPVRGVAVISTVGINWYEYELANLRRQLNLQHMAPDSVELVMRRKIDCGFHFLVERESRATLLAREPQCVPSISYPASDEYMQAAASHDPATAWKAVTQPVLLLYGSADFITSHDEHVALAAAINRMHPGQATFAEVPEMDHYLAHEASQQASYDDPTPGLSRPYDGRTLEPVLAAWLDRISKIG